MNFATHATVALLPSIRRVVSFANLRAPNIRRISVQEKGRGLPFHSTSEPQAKPSDEPVSEWSAFVEKFMKGPRAASPAFVPGAPGLPQFVRQV